MCRQWVREAARLQALFSWYLWSSSDIHLPGSPVKARVCQSHREESGERTKRVCRHGLHLPGGTCYVLIIPQGRAWGHKTAAWSEPCLPPSTSQPCACAWWMDYLHVSLKHSPLPTLTLRLWNHSTIEPGIHGE